MRAGGRTIVSSRPADEPATVAPITASSPSPIATAAAGGRALRFEATHNRAASPYRYEIDPDDLYRLTIATDDADEVFWGIVHSHVHSPAVPSPTDIGLAFYPDALYVLVSLSDESVRAWRILDDAVHEVELEA